MEKKHSFPLKAFWTVSNIYPRVPRQRLAFQLIRNAHKRVGLNKHVRAHLILWRMKRKKKIHFKDGRKRELPLANVNHTWHAWHASSQGWGSVGMGQYRNRARATSRLQGSHWEWCQHRCRKCSMLFLTPCPAVLMVLPPQGISPSQHWVWRCLRSPRRQATLGEKHEPELFWYRCFTALHVLLASHLLVSLLLVFKHD